jgi:hypothetical protein
MNARLCVGLVGTSLWLGCGGNVVGDPSAGAGGDAGSTVSATNPASPSEAAARATAYCTSMATKAKECGSSYFSSAQCTTEATCMLQVFPQRFADSVLKCAESGTCRTDLGDCIEDASRRSTASAAAANMQMRCYAWSSQCNARMDCDLDGYVLMSDAAIGRVTKCFESGCNVNPYDCLRTELAAIAPICAALKGGSGGGDEDGPPNGGSGGSSGGSAPTVDASAPMPPAPQH